jgi:DNA-binding response OmpR family regulator
MSRPCGPILVVDDDDALLRCVSVLLEEDGFVVFAARTGEEALALARRASLGAAVVDICLPGLSGYEVCRVLKEEKATLPVIFISGERRESFDRVGGLLIGADDYLVKPFAPDELLARLRTLVRRSPQQENHGLARREAEVLRCLSEGLGSSAIGERLVISPKTVGTHIEHIYEKLGVHSRAQALAAAYGHGLLTPY